ncbi:MAG TPA: transcription termination/antitermination NusG family protein, partial [Dongiaceae bacterium]|nr:transcription termination/antitermination NusG family protein [Dongiaceae bacterium]
MTKHWFAIHTYSGHENKVKNNLERAIKNAGMEENFGRIIVAMEDHAEMKDGQRVVSRRKTFPSYVLLEMELSSETQALVAAVP